MKDLAHVLKNHKGRGSVMYTEISINLPLLPMNDIKIIL